jgi:D-alanyl-D-alanine dipeptidase
MVTTGYGNPFDFFWEEASHGYAKLSEEVKDNRMLLKSIMTAAFQFL